MLKLKPEEIEFLRNCPRIVTLSRNIKATPQDTRTLAMLTRLRQREKPLINWTYLDRPVGQPLQLDVQLTMVGLELLRTMPR